MTETFRRLSTADAAIVLVDHQPGVLAMAGSLPPEAVTTNAAILAGLGEQLDLPLVITSTQEHIEYLGTTLTAVQEAAPKAYENRIRRTGTLNAFDDPAFVAAVADTKRSRLVIAGLLTDVCLFHSAVSAVAAGYEVTVVADASGTSTPLADAVTYDRLRSYGIQAASTYGVLFELFPDVDTPEGQQARGIAAAAVGMS